MNQRNIVLWYVLSIVTFGIGFVVWYYKLNNDAKRLAHNTSWSPAISVLAITLGAIVIIPPLVSHWRTWSRIREATHGDGMGSALQVVLCFVPLVNLAYWGYLQSKLNASASTPSI